MPSHAPGRLLPAPHLLFFMPSALHLFRALCLLAVLAFSGCSSAIPVTRTAAEEYRFWATLEFDREGRAQSVEVIGDGNDDEAHRQRVKNSMQKNMKNWQFPKAKPGDPAIRKVRVPARLRLTDSGPKPLLRGHSHSASHLFPKKKPSSIPASSSPSPTP